MIKGQKKEWWRLKNLCYFSKQKRVLRKMIIAKFGADFELKKELENGILKNMKTTFKNI